MVKAVALLSGGLDSILATKLILEQGIEVEALNFLTVFCTCTPANQGCLASRSAAERLGIKLKVIEASQEYLEILKKPKFGYGANMNPCLDCRILFFKKAKEYMQETNASFLITGEVLGERPMSQRREALRLIERETGLEGLILRPLSARLLEPTIPEEKGWVDRERLLSIQGRCRKPQIRLAKDLAINDYPCPSGGCLLTDPAFSRRVKDLIKYKSDFDLNDVVLLKLGRHFRLSPQAKLIVGRNEKENNSLLNLAKKDDLCLYPVKIKGPTGILRGKLIEELICTCAGIIARYSDNNGNKQIEIAYRRVPYAQEEVLRVNALSQEKLSSWRI